MSLAKQAPAPRPSAPSRVRRERFDRFMAYSLVDVKRGRGQHRDAYGLPALQGGRASSRDARFLRFARGGVEDLAESSDGGFVPLPDPLTKETKVQVVEVAGDLARVHQGGMPLIRKLLRLTKESSVTSDDDSSTHSRK